MTVITSICQIIMLKEIIDLKDGTQNGSRWTVSCTIIIFLRLDRSQDFLDDPRSRANSCIHELQFTLLGPITCLTLLVPETKIADFANSINPDEIEHNQPPHLDPHCFPH